MTANHMTIVIISDIHGNYDALAAVFNRITVLAPDRIYCAGDTVGYGAQPSECINLLREHEILSVAGNHDFAVVGVMPTDYFNDDADRSVQWTRAMLSADDIAWLTNLPLIIEEDDFVLFHGSLAAPESFSYILSQPEAEAAFALLDRPVGFFGHSHAPLSFLQQDNRIIPTMDELLDLTGTSGALINAGSVGQPRDFNPLAAFALYDLAAHTVRIERVAYDTIAAARKIVEAGLPASNARRLSLGR